MRLGAEQHLDGAAYHRDSRRAAHQHDFIDLLDGDAGVGNAGATGAKRPLDDIGDQFLEQLPGDFAAVALIVVLEVDGGKWNERKLFLGLDDGAAESLHGFAIAREILSPFRLNVLKADA